MLRNFALLNTRRLDVANAALSKVWIPHRTQLLSLHEAFHCNVNICQLFETTLGFMTERGSLHVHSDSNASEYFIILRRTGNCAYRTIGETVLLDRDSAVVHSPGYRAQIWTKDCLEVLNIAIDSNSVRRELERQIQHSVKADLRFAPRMNMRTVSGRSLERVAIRLCLALDTGALTRFNSLIAIRQQERNLISLLIEGHSHNYTRMLRDPSASLWQVRAVEEFIRANADQPLSLGDLAMAAGVSARALQYSFRKNRGYSPMRFLRTVRLERIRDELLNSDSGTSVSAVATHWGFLHFGRFAADYRRRFGELPSLTARK